MADDDTTKLIIYGFGIGAILFFAYLIFRDFSSRDYYKRRYGFMSDEFQPPQIQPQQLTQPQTLQYPSTELQLIQQKLSLLENKIDNFVKSDTVKQLTTQKVSQSEPTGQSERKTVSMKSMSSKAETMKMSRDLFGMR